MLNTHLFRFGNKVSKFLSLSKNGQGCCYYSRRSSSKQSSTFKIVSKQADTVDAVAILSPRTAMIAPWFRHRNQKPKSHLPIRCFTRSFHQHWHEVNTGGHLGVNPNWELLDPHGYSFFLPGSVGLAWTEPQYINSINQYLGLENLELECVVQECPVLLRQGVVDMFPGAKLGPGTISVLTLSQRGAKNKMKKSQLNEQELEKLTKLFVLVAQDICVKLKVAGFWADFINPFSGLPYLNPYYNPKLQELDKQLTSSGFCITEQNNCRVIANSGTKNVVGSLYTAAPPNTALLQDILHDFEMM